MKKLQVKLAVWASLLTAAFRRDALALANNKPAPAAGNPPPGNQPPAPPVENKETPPPADLNPPLQQKQQQPQRGAAEAELGRINAREAGIKAKMAQSGGLLTREQAAQSYDNQIRFNKAQNK
jgi:hypothetical protein